MSHGAPIAIVRFSGKGRKDRFVRLAVATPHNDDFLLSLHPTIARVLFLIPVSLGRATALGGEPRALPINKHVMPRRGKHKE